MRPTHRDTDFILRVMDRVLNCECRHCTTNDPKDMVTHIYIGLDRRVLHDVVGERDLLLKYIAERMPMQHQIFEKAIAGGKTFEEALVAGIMRVDTEDTMRLFREIFDVYDTYIRVNSLPEPAIVAEVRAHLYPESISVTAGPATPSLQSGDDRLPES